MVGGVGYKEIPSRVEGNAKRILQLSRFSGASVAAEARLSRSRHRRDRSLGSHHAYAVIACVCNIQISLAIQRKMPRIVQLSRNGLSAIAAESRCPFPCHRADYTIGRNLADAGIVGICDVNVSGGIRGDSAGTLKPDKCENGEVRGLSPALTNVILRRRFYINSVVPGTATGSVGLGPNSNFAKVRSSLDEFMAHSQEIARPV